MILFPRRDPWSVADSVSRAKIEHVVAGGRALLGVPAPGPAAPAVLAHGHRLDRSCSTGRRVDGGLAIDVATTDTRVVLWAAAAVAACAAVAVAVGTAAGARPGGHPRSSQSRRGRARLFPDHAQRDDAEHQN